MLIRKWAPKLDVVYDDKLRYEPIEDTKETVRGRLVEAYITKIKVFYSDENGKHHAQFTCRKDGMCELHYTVKKKIKGIIFSHDESHSYDETIPSKDLDFKKYAKNVRILYKDSYGRNAVKEHRLTFIVSKKS